jgi:hypothetical protein
MDEAGEGLFYFFFLSAPVEKPLQTGEDEDSSSDDESDSTLSVASAGDMKSNSPHGSVHEGKGV